MAKFNAYFFSDNAKEHAQFYIEALGGEIKQVMTHGDTPGTNPEWKDRVMHMNFVAAGVEFFMSDAVLGPTARGNGLELCLEFSTEEEAHSAFDRLAAGGKVLDPLTPQFWGALFGRLVDKYGVHWMITTTAKAG